MGKAYFFKSVLLTVFALMTFSSAKAQSDFSHMNLEDVKGMFIYNFVKYSSWPPADENQGEFVIAVFDDAKMVETMQKYFARGTKNGRKYVLKNVKTTAEFQKCDVVFIPRGKSKDFEALNGKINSSSVLVIADKPGLTDKGAQITFRMKDNKLTFDVSKAALQKSSVKVSEQLLALGNVI